MTTQLVQLPKWSSWEVETFSRVINGVKEYAYMVLEYKWHSLQLEDGYKLIPSKEHKIIAPLFSNLASDRVEGFDNNEAFVIDGTILNEESDGGYCGIDFVGQDHIEKEFKALEGDNPSERDVLEQMGFGEDEWYIVVQGGAL